MSATVVRGQPVDTSAYRVGQAPCGAGFAVVGLVLFEGVLVGMSALASEPEGDMDKAMGIYFGAASVLMVGLAAHERWGSNSDDGAADTRDRLIGAGMMIGLGYGLFRASSYNLWEAEGDDRSQRFTRNMLELHAAYVVPIGVGALAMHFFRERSSKTTTSLLLDGRGLTFAMNF